MIADYRKREEILADHAGLRARHSGKRTSGAWEVFSGFDDNEMYGVLPTPTQQEKLECRQIKNNGCDLAHCYGPDRRSNAALMAAAPEMATAIDAILRHGLTAATRTKAKDALAKARQGGA